MNRNGSMKKCKNMIRWLIQIRLMIRLHSNKLTIFSQIIQNSNNRIRYLKVLLFNKINIFYFYQFLTRIINNLNNKNLKKNRITDKFKNQFKSQFNNSSLLNKLKIKISTKFKFKNSINFKIKINIMINIKCKYKQRRI